MKNIKDMLEAINEVEYMKGPLGSHKNYIRHIALENCHEYFNLVQANQEKKKVNISDITKEFRYYINAVESLNNILEYIYFDTHPNEDYSNPSPQEFKKRFLDEHPELKLVADRANAYKHCKRGQMKKGKYIIDDEALHASDLANNTLYFHAGSAVGKPLVKLQYSFAIDEDSQDIVEHAFRFWLHYLENAA